MSIGPLGQNLIFIISQPRAGSTLLQRVLAAHPDIGTVAEPWVMLHPVYALRHNGIKTEFQSDLAYKALDSFLALFPDYQETYLHGLRAMGLEIYNAAGQMLGTPFFIDKTPRYYFIIPELMRIFPEATFIILLRNPLAVLASILNTFVGGVWTRMARRHYSDLLVAPRLLLDGIQQLGQRAIVLHYEDLVTDPGTHVGQICARLGLEFSEEMLQYGEYPAPQGRYGDPSGVQRYQQPTAQNVDRWLELGATRQNRHFALRYLQALGPDLLSQLGYDFAEIRAQIKAVPCARSGLAVSWDQIFRLEHTFWNKLYLITYELLQKRDWGHSAKQFGRLFLGRLSL